MGNKLYNTLKMMGVKGRDLIEFVDAHESYHLTVSPVIKAAYRKVLLETKIYGKTLIEWHAEIVKAGIANGSKIAIDNGTRTIRESDFNFTVDNIDLQLSTINLVIHHILQAYYADEYKIQN